MYTTRLHIRLCVLYREARRLLRVSDLRHASSPVEASFWFRAAGIGASSATLEVVYKEELELTAMSCLAEV